jgi:hypothetical protein
MKTIYVCGHCGSPRVYVDAYKNLNDLDEVLTYDHTVCFDCDSTDWNEEVEVPDDFNMEYGRYKKPAKET